MTDLIDPIRPQARPEVVEELTSRMLAGAMTLRGYSADELASAVFTLMARTCAAVLKRSTDEQATREALTGGLMKIMADVMPDRKAA